MSYTMVPGWEHINWNDEVRLMSREAIQAAIAKKEAAALDNMDLNELRGLDECPPRYEDAISQIRGRTKDVIYYDEVSFEPSYVRHGANPQAAIKHMIGAASNWNGTQLSKWQLEALDALVETHVQSHQIYMNGKGTISDIECARIYPEPIMERGAEHFHHCPECYESYSCGLNCSIAFQDGDKLYGSHCTCESCEEAKPLQDHELTPEWWAKYTGVKK